MKTHFAFIVYPVPPQTMLQNASLMFQLFGVFLLKRGEGEATFHDGREENSQLGKIWW